MHDRRWTLEKIQARIALIKAHLVYRKRQVLPNFRIHVGTEPLVGSGVDDSGWESIEARDYWGAHRQDFTLRTSFAVPEDWQQPVALYLPLGTSKSLEALAFLYGPETLAYVDEIPYQGIDPNHKEILLPPNMLDGEQHTLALYGWTGIKDEQYEMGQPQLVQIDPATRDLLLTSEAVLQVIQVLPPNSPERTQLLNALDRAFLQLDLREPYGHHFYESVSEALVVLQEGVDSAGTPMNVKVTGVGHAHIDVAWLWTLRQTRSKAARSFSTVLRLMEQYPEFRFSQSQPQLYRYIEEDFPEILDQIKARVDENRWEILGGMWVEADCNLTGAEALARQFVLGRQYFLDQFGKRDAPILWLPDVFGYAWQLPQLIRQAGLSYFVTAKLSWNQYNRIPFDVFWWQGLDGTQIFTYFITTSKPGWWGATYSADLSPEEMMSTWEGFQNKDALNEFMIAFGHGDGGGGPTFEMIEHSRRLANLAGSPMVELGTAESFLERIRQQAGDKLPVWDGELYLELHRGTYTSQARNKRLNRKGEFLLHDAEFLAAWAALNETFAYPHQELQRAWELLCLNQFHDIIPGSSIHEVYEDSKRDYDEIFEIGERIRDEALIALETMLPQNADLVVFNPTSFACSEVVEIDDAPPGTAFALADGTVLPVQALENGCLIEVPQVPPYGFLALWTVQDAAPPVTGSVHATPDSLENAFLRVELDAAGDIVRLYDKQNEREVLADGQKGNVFQAFEDRPLDWEAWDIESYFDEKYWHVDPASSIEVIESGPLRARLQIKRKVLGSEIIQDVILYRNSARLDFRTWVDWRERRILLKVAFPVSVLSPRATYEIQWGNVERPTHQNTSWDWARFESCAHKWVDLSEGDYGVSLLNDCKYGHDIQGNLLRLTLLKGAMFPDPEADLGEHEFTYSILPHRDDWRSGTVPAAYALNDPLIIHRIRNGGGATERQASASLICPDTEHVIIETIKQAEDGNGLVVRLYEHERTRGQVTLTADFGIQQAFLTNLLEEAEEELGTEGGQVSLSFTPYQIATLRLLPQKEER